MTSNRESRIAARRIRIAARLRGAKASQTTNTPNEAHEETLYNVVKTKGFTRTFLKAQLKDKVLRLQNLAHDRTFNQLSLNISHYQDLDSFADQEHEFVAKGEESTKSRYALSSIIVPQQLFQKRNTLCDKYENIILSKEKIIVGLYEELKLKDEEYSVAMKQQAQHMTKLLVEMGRQVTMLRDFYLKELHDMENYLLAHRATLIESNKLEMNVLIQDRQYLENKYHDELEALKESVLKLIDGIREDDIEEFNALKARLENDCQNLEQHLQNMHAIYQLNTEKLDYNFWVLIEREHENYMMSNQQKKKITKQRDALSNVKGRHRELEKKFIEQNDRLTDDYLRVTRLLQDLLQKEEQQQAIHASIRRRFFSMHLHTISCLVSSVLQADRKIHKQELGWHWRSPHTKLFAKLGCMDPIKYTNPNKDQDKVTNERSIVSPLLDTLADERYHFFLENLTKEAGFLIDKESTKVVREMSPKLQQQGLCSIILNALGVNNSSSLEKLFITLTDKLDDNEALSVSHLKGFVQGEKSSQDLLSSQNKKKKLVTSPHFQVGEKSAKAMSIKLKWEGYWRSFTTIMSPKVLCVWKHLDSALFNYNRILKDRLFVSKDVVKLRQRNQMLQEALNHLSSKEVSD